MYWFESQELKSYYSTYIFFSSLCLLAFLTMPENKKSGVLLVYVYEGRNAPYVCNGSIYVRSGSSKEPIKPADRGNIEYLYERSKEYIKEIEDFCQILFV